jgi:RNA polymerase sigma-70 factor (ECF subfamily)
VAVSISKTSTAGVDADGLLLLVAGGDRAAFAALYDLASARVHGIVRRVLVDQAQSEEVTQDVFLEIWQHASRFDPEVGHAVGWILTIAHRKAVDRVRASQASRNRDLKIGIRDMPREFDHVAEEVEITVEHSRARSALANITELQRQVVTLAYFDGLSQNEIAEKLNVKVGTVKTRLRDGLMRLRIEMAATA